MREGLVATRALGVLDDQRVPYRVASGSGPWHRLGAASPERAVHWYADGGDAARHTLRGAPIWASVAADAEAAAFVDSLEGRWQRETEIADAEGRVQAWIWRSDDGGTVLPFDPDEVIANYRSERYLEIHRGKGTSLKGVARHLYYRIRPVVPRRVQLAVRRLFSHVQAHEDFPRWPIEPALHDFTAEVLACVADAADEPVPCLGAWPRGHSWALVLTHDVETAVGREAIERVRAVEAALGLRSSWNLVPERYEVPDELVRHLGAVGCEVGVHGLRHDGRDLESLRTLKRRLPEMRRWAARWGAVGFRSPATHRRWEWMPLMGFDYDTSYPDTDPYEPMGGGCCSWLPFFNEELVELPLTLAQDHTLFEILRIGDGPWHEKTELLRRRGGLALIDVHPDYMLGDESLHAYERLLAAYADDASAWKALPREVSEWWRRRAETSIEMVDGRWRAAGPAAAEADVTFLRPASSPSASARSQAA